jgi:3-oxoacyl-[acyl-carrier protein] reductase
MIDFKGKTVLVTGGGAGIGRAIAEAFGKAGAAVAVAEIKQDRADDVRKALTAADVKNLVTTTDVTKSAGVNALMGEIESKLGGLDVLVNNVGDFLGMAKPFERFSDDEIDALHAVNLKSAFVCSRAAIPLLRKRGRGGSIICVSSIEAFRGIPMTVVYSAYKHALTGFTRSLALELGPDGIRVNTIAPETTDTAQVPVGLMVPEEHKHHIPRWLPLGRFGKPEDAAGVALFLASDMASWITGTTINLDGGALAAGGWYRDPKGTWTNLPVVTGNGLNF